jgi:hypothetical protein
VFKLSLALIGAASIALATPAFAAPVEDFHELMDDYWADDSAKESPLLRLRRASTTYDVSSTSSAWPSMDRRRPRRKRSCGG